MCLCKAASLNANIKLSFDRTKAREYFDIVGDIIFKDIIYKNKKAYLIQEDIGETEEGDYNIASQYDEILNELKKENVNVLDGFRELIILEFRR